MNEKIRCRAVVFDFDGTVADSMPFLEQIGVATMMKYFDVTKEEATERYRSTTGLPYEHQIKTNFPGNAANDSAIEEFEHMKIERIFDQELFDDTIQVVAELNRRGILVFVSSSTFQPTIEEYFRRRGIMQLFKGIVGYKPGFEKGADHFNYIRDKYGVEFDEMVFVGDSLRDQKRAEGFCRFIALEGMFTQQDFRNQGHTGPVVSSLSEIPDLVEAGE
jgi:phosphoglycolate phosphatase-like HAD superfamily hydrolase